MPLVDRRSAPPNSGRQPEEIQRQQWTQSPRNVELAQPDLFGQYERKEGESNSGEVEKCPIAPRIPHERERKECKGGAHQQVDTRLGGPVSGGICQTVERQADLLDGARPIPRRQTHTHIDRPHCRSDCRNANEEEGLGASTPHRKVNGQSDHSDQHDFTSQNGSCDSCDGPPIFTVQQRGDRQHHQCKCDHAGTEDLEFESDPRIQGECQSPPTRDVKLAGNSDGCPRADGIAGQIDDQHQPSDRLRTKGKSDRRKGWIQHPLSSVARSIEKGGVLGRLEKKRVHCLDEKEPTIVSQLRRNRDLPTEHPFCVSYALRFLHAELNRTCRIPLALTQVGSHIDQPQQDRHDHNECRPGCSLFTCRAIGQTGPLQAGSLYRRRLMTSQGESCGSTSLAHAPVALWSLVLVALTVLYALTATWSYLDQNVDVLAAGLPGWRMATEGSWFLDDFAGSNPWLVQGSGGIVSDRPVGLVAAAALAHLVALPFTTGFTGVPITVLAVIVTSAAVVIIGYVVDRLAGRRVGLAAATAIGLGASSWPISSSQLWPHGLNQLWLALALLSLSKGKHWLAGAFLGMGILTRPPLAVAAAVIGVGLAITRKSRGPLFTVGIPSVVAVGLLVAYNSALFGTPSLSGGYGDFVQGGSEYRTATGYLLNLFGTFVDPTSGLLVWSPWLIMLIPTIRGAWHDAPDWVKVAAVAGTVYLLVHTGLNRFWGGLAFNYRYVLEPLTLAMPLLGLSIRDRLRRPPGLFQHLLWSTIALAIVLQGIDATLSECITVGDTATCRLLGY